MPSLPRSRRTDRQVLDGGEGVREATALALATLEWVRRQRSKLQTPSSKEAPSFKSQRRPGELSLPATAEPLFSRSGPSFWSLVLGASLGFGAWDLELRKIRKQVSK